MPAISSEIAKPHIDLVDETFDASHSESYHLSIQIEPGGLSFCVFNTVLHKYIVLRSYPLFINDFNKLVEQCSTIFKNDDLSGLYYKSSSNLWVSPRCTLVPGHFFDSDSADAYLTFTHGASAGEQTLHNHIRASNLYNVFSCPVALLTLLRHYQPNIRLFHQATTLIGSIVSGISSDKTDLAAYFYSRYMDIAVVRKKELLFYNTFQVNAPEDAVYYLTGASNRFDINLSSTKLIHAGDFKQTTPPQAEILRKYVSSIMELDPPKDVTYSHYLQSPVLKRFVHLFNLYGCES